VRAAHWRISKALPSAGIFAPLARRGAGAAGMFSSSGIGAPVEHEKREGEGARMITSIGS
jgi:hypothetical protein